ncbi:MAG: sensor histidine kinase [Patescibacteria group bacterium]
MRLVFSLLIDNAIRYTKSEKNIKISYKQTKTHVQIIIADEGIGIPKAEQVNIFDRFYRASNAQAIYPDGVGLGLYIVKAIVEAHDGSIDLKSEEGKGTTFTISLPLT